MVHCPICKEKGLNPKLTKLGTTNTGLFCKPFVDEKGYHSHNPSDFTTSYRCEFGHLINHKYKILCPNCDYGKGEKTIEVVGQTAKETVYEYDFFEVKTYNTQHAVHFTEHEGEVDFSIFSAYVDDNNVLSSYPTKENYSEKIQPNDFLPHLGLKYMYGFIKWRGIWDERILFTDYEFDGDELKELSELYNTHILPYCKRILANKYPEKVGSIEED